MSSLSCTAFAQGGQPGNDRGVQLKILGRALGSFFLLRTVFTARQLSRRNAALRLPLRPFDRLRAQGTLRANGGKENRRTIAVRAERSRESGEVEAQVRSLTSCHCPSRRREISSLLFSPFHPCLHRERGLARGLDRGRAHLLHMRGDHLAGSFGIAGLKRRLRVVFQE